MPDRLRTRDAALLAAERRVSPRQVATLAILEPGSGGTAVVGRCIGRCIGQCIGEALDELLEAGSGRRRHASPGREDT